MKTINRTVNEVKDEVTSLLGKPVKMAVNRGRKQIVRFDGEIVATYPSVFTVKAYEPQPLTTMSYAYTEIVQFFLDFFIYFKNCVINQFSGL